MTNSPCLGDRFEVVRDIGDGSFGSVVLAKVKRDGYVGCKRGALVAIKTMKKTFESFAPCLELREVIFLKTLPTHIHLVPALDIFLDPATKKLHIAMEVMDGNLYQLMKAREQKVLDGGNVKSILFQILSGLQHIHEHGFFHRDIKPENILVSTSPVAPEFPPLRQKYSLNTPPATPTGYAVKIADFGLAREMSSKMPYTTYVSTRWYRAPEVLLRAGEYSAPVDIWAVGAMAVELATLKPLFPGSNEVDQVWRICEIMGSPGHWVNKLGKKIGGGEWKEGHRLANKLGFAFPRMAPVSMSTILPEARWPPALRELVTSCLLWDPARRPTSISALRHPYFQDAVDPVLAAARTTTPVRSSRSRAEMQPTPPLRENEHPGAAPSLSSKPSWFRRSLVGSANQQATNPPPSINTQLTPQATPQRLTPVESPARDELSPLNVGKSLFGTKPKATEKRHSWQFGKNNHQNQAAPMPILPTIRPISPLSDTVTAQAAAYRSNRNSVVMTDASSTIQRKPSVMEEKASKKLGRQLSVNSSQHYNPHIAQAHEALNGRNSQVTSPTKESLGIFAHLRKKARRLSGRSQMPVSPHPDDLEAGVGCFSSNRSSMYLDNASSDDYAGETAHSERHPSNNPHSSSTLVTVEESSPNGHSHSQPRYSYIKDNNSHYGIKDPRRVSVPGQPSRSMPDVSQSNGGPISSRTRKATQNKPHISRYDAPDEEDELLQEQLFAHQKNIRRMEAGGNRRESSIYQNQIRRDPAESYPSPTSATRSKNNGSWLDRLKKDQGHAMDIPTPTKKRSENYLPKWPTPPDDSHDWFSAPTVDLNTGFLGNYGRR